MNTRNLAEISQADHQLQHCCSLQVLIQQVSNLQHRDIHASNIEKPNLPKQRSIIVVVVGKTL